MVSSSATAGATSSGFWAGGFGKGALLSGDRPWKGRSRGLGGDPTSPTSTGAAIGARVTFRRGGRRPAVQTERADPGHIWIVLFLGVALVMVVVGLAWLAFGPPIL